jgi:ABC-type nitrate/sulfonate/bicarbonate transport system substrate-binding protein
MKKKIIILIVIIILIIIAVVSSYNKEQKEQKSELDKVYVRLKWIYQAQFAGFFTAEQKGFYKEQGINVTLTPGGAESPSIQMVAGGGEQFGVTGMSQLMEARAKGVPVVALAVIYRKNPLIWFSVNEDVNSAEDLVGRKVGVTIGSNSDILFKAMLKKAGVDIEKVERVPVTYDISPVLTRQVDAYEGYIINQPITAREKGFKTFIINPADYGINFYADTLFTTEKMIKENPDLVRRFVKATLQGWEYAYSHPDEAVDYTLMYSDQLKKEHETAMMQASLELLKPDDKPIGTIDRQVLEEMHDLLISNNILENPLDLDKLYTIQFLE